MSELLFQTESYLNSFESLVIAVDLDKHAVALDRTAFYPGGGGQPADIGTLTISGQIFPVTKVGRAGNLIYHFLAADLALPSVGAPVLGEIDWPRRYQLMRTHTALHVLCGVVFRDYGALVTGGNMDPLQGRMDFEFETMQKELVHQIQENINQEVANARLVKVTILPREQAFQIPDLIRTKINLLPDGIQEVRVVEIVGLDMQADGGTHVKNTSEIGQIQVTDYKSKGKINKRIYIEVKDAT